MLMSNGKEMYMPSISNVIYQIFTRRCFVCAKWQKHQCHARIPNHLMLFCRLYPIFDGKSC